MSDLRLDRGGSVGDRFGFTGSLFFFLRFSSFLFPSFFLSSLLFSISLSFTIRITRYVQGSNRTTGHGIGLGRGMGRELMGLFVYQRGVEHEVYGWMALFETSPLRSLIYNTTLSLAEGERWRGRDGVCGKGALHPQTHNTTQYGTWGFCFALLWFALVCFGLVWESAIRVRVRVGVGIGWVGVDVGRVGRSRSR